MHVYDASRPLAPSATFKPPHAPWSAYCEVQRALGLSRAVLVQPADYAIGLVTTLLRAGADANAMRPKGGAPLHNLIFGAAALPAPAVAQIATLLAQHGADVNLPAEFDGATALDIARAKNNQAAINLLSAMGGTCRTSC